MPEFNEDTGVWHTLERINPSEAEFPIEINVDGQEILILKTSGGFRAVQALCPHQGVPLLKGVLMSNDTMVRCSRHNFIFRLDNGDGVNCRGLNMKVYGIRKNDAFLEILLPT